MNKKSTDELLDALTKTNHIENYMKENAEYLIDCTLADALNKMLKEKGLVKSKVLKQAEMNEIYGFQIFAGKRNPSRDKLICLCIGMSLNLNETQELLKIGGFAPLYPKNKRDSIIIYGINNSLNVCGVNGILYNQTENTLF